MMKYLFHLNLISLAQRWSELHLSWLMLKHEDPFMLWLQQRDTRRLSYQTQPAAFSSLILTGFKAQKQQTVSIKNLVGGKTGVKFKITPQRKEWHTVDSYNACVMYNILNWIVCDWTCFTEVVLLSAAC